jgi:hypothetical protein
MTEGQALLAIARAEVDAEQQRAAIDAIKARLRNRKTLGQRIAAWLPFTITWKTQR